MRNFVLAVALVAVMSIPAVAQEHPGIEYFNGFSYLNLDTAGAGASFYGYQTDFSGNFNDKFGITVDFGAQFKSELGTTLQFYQYLVGPRIAARREKLTAFAHALFGGATIRASGLGSENGFAMGFGGGLDLNVGDSFAIRIVQADYLPARLGGVWAHNVRVGIGFVIKSGH